MAYKLTINDTTVDINFNNFSESMEWLQPGLLRELHLTYGSENSEDIMNISTDIFTPFFAEDSIQSVNIVNDDNEVVFSSTAYSKLQGVSKTGNALSDLEAYEFSVRIAV